MVSKMYRSAATNKSGMPDINDVTIRRGGILTMTDNSLAIALGGISLSRDAVSEIAAGNYNTLAHELRHITQQSIAQWGYLEFAMVWLNSDGKVHDQDVPGNGGEAYL